MIKQQENCHDHNGHSHADPHICCGKGQNQRRAEQCTANISRDIGGRGKQVLHQIAQRKSAHGQHGNGGIAFDLCALIGAQQYHSTRHRHRHDQQHTVAEPQHCGNGKRTKRHVRQTVTNDGKTLQHQCYAQQRRTQSDQHAGNQRILHK